MRGRLDGYCLQSEYTLESSAGLIHASDHGRKAVNFHKTHLVAGQKSAQVAQLSLTHVRRKSGHKNCAKLVPIVLRRAILRRWGIVRGGSCLIRLRWRGSISAGIIRWHSGRVRLCCCRSRCDNILLRVLRVRRHRLVCASRPSCSFQSKARHTATGCGRGYEGENTLQTH
jgi:hypothetical protein